MGPEDEGFIARDGRAGGVADGAGGKAGFLPGW
jgi:hypothetical protein